MLAVHLENLLFLLLLVVAGLFQLLGRAARKGSTDETKRTSEPPLRMPKPIQRAPVESDEQRVRKFLEALGQPTATRPPPPVSQRPTYRKPLVLPHVPPLGSPLPPLVTRPPELPSEFEVHREPPPPPTPRPSRPLPEPTFQIHEAVAPPELVPVVVTTVPEAKSQQPIAALGITIHLTALLRSPTGLRDAIIVREILGPPSGLQELDLL